MSTNRNLSKELIIVTLPEMETMGDRVIGHLEDMGDHRFRRVPIKWHEFANREFTPELEESVRHGHVYLLAAPGLNPSEDVLRVMLTINALATNDAFTIRGIMTHLTNDREDKTSGRRVSLSASVIANMLLLNDKVERIVTMDPHCEQMQGFYTKGGVVKLDILEANALHRDYVKANWADKLSNLVVASPDIGGIKRARRFAGMLGPDVEFASMNKHRPKDNVAEITDLVYSGNIRGKDVILVDDMGDTLGTIIAAGKKIEELGGRVLGIMLTHWIASPGAQNERAEDRMRAAGFHVVTTNSLPRKPAYYEEHRDFLTVIDLSKHLARTIHELSIRGGCFSDLNG